MQIIILGAGQVGSTLAEHLVHEENDVTIVDIDRRRLEDLQNRLDIQTVHGSGAYPDILQRAGATSADMLIAVTSSDETNIVACQVAYTLFHTPTKIARIRSRHYQTHETLFDKAAMPIDYWISPEQLITRNICRLIESPGAKHVVNFAKGEYQLVLTQIRPDSNFVNTTISDIEAQFPDVPFIITAVLRKNQLIQSSAALKLQVNDEVYFICVHTEVKTVLQRFVNRRSAVKRIMIAGGGNVGVSLGAALENKYNVKLIEFSNERTNYLVEELYNTTILLGDVSDRELLLQEHIDNIDFFCAVTNDDETNVMASLQAKRLGAEQCIALVNKPNYVDLLRQVTEIDVVLSPQLFTIGRILKYIRRGDVSAVHVIGRGVTEALEMIAHGDEQTSKVIGCRIADLPLPVGTLLAAVIRHNSLLTPEEAQTIQAADHVILYLTERKYLRKIERLFQVSATFL